MGNGEAYRKALQKLVDEMNASLLYWLTVRWRDDPPQLAMDESWISALERTMRELGARWQSRFDEAAPKLAAHYAQRAADRATGRVAEIMGDAGWTVRFNVSPLVRTMMGAAVSENVGLIKSIASEHLSDVRGLVMRSVTTGGDLEFLSRALRDRFDAPRRRAELIARDQNSKMTAVITRVRQQEAGIERAIWVHSHGGKVPRPEHLAFSGQEYDVARGAFLEGVWTWPGHEINCRCFSRPVLAGFSK